MMLGECRERMDKEKKEQGERGVTKEATRI